MENQKAEWFKAAKSGNLVTIDRMINAGIDLNIKDKNGNTALMLAVKETNLEVVKRLIKGDDSKVSALDVILDFVNAWKNGQPWSDKDLVRWKNKVGLDLFAQNNDGNTALMLAVESAHSYDQDQAEAQYEIVDQLNSVFNKLYYPFLCVYNNKEFIRVMCKIQRLRKRLEIMKNHRSETAFQIALENAVRFPNTMLPLHLAHEQLISKYAGNLSEKNSQGETLLMLDVDRDYYGWSREYWPLAWMSISRWKGFNVNEKDNDGTTALMRSAIGDDKVGALELMLDSLQKFCHIQVDVDAKNNWGYNALHFAVEKGSPEKIRMLIEHGADVNAMTRYGMTPLKIAQRRGNANIIAQLRAAGAR